MQYLRQSSRIRNYDYSQVGYYFITLCTYDHSKLFCTIEDSKVYLEDIGVILWECWKAIPDHFPDITLDECVIMPNHLHGILMINKKSKTQYEEFGKPTIHSIPTVIRSLKSAVTKEVHDYNYHDGKIWQRSYWEHIIRSERELHEIRKYIKDNPARWEIDSQHKR